MTRARRRRLRRARVGESSRLGRRRARAELPSASLVTRREALLAGAGGLLVAGVGMALTSLGARGPEEVVAETPVEPVVAASPSEPTAKGRSDAPVHMLDFSSYTCGHCASFTLEVEPLIDRDYVEPGLLYFRFVHVAFGPLSERASEAAECAGAQGAFWPYHRELMARQVDLYRRHYPDVALVEIATDLGLDTERFSKDLVSGRYLPRVAEAGREADRRDVHATPTFFINDVEVLGARPFSDFQRIIDEALANSGHG